MKTLIFDLSAIQPTDGKYHGGAEYAIAVLKQLNRSIVGSKFCLRGIALNNTELDSRVLRFIDASSIFYVKDRRSIAQYAVTNEVDRFYSALPYEYDSCAFEGVEVVITIHGLRQLEMPHDRYEWLYERSLTGKCKVLLRFLVSSYYTFVKKREIENLLNIPCKSLFITVPTLHTKFSLISFFPEIEHKKIFICHSPLRSCEPLNNEEADIYLKAQRVVKKNYVLLVSSSRWLKNAYRALMAIDQLIDDGLFKSQVILTGIEQDHGVLRRIKNKERFHAVGYVAPAVLEMLFRDACFLLYPSLNEGFGYPPIEAMKYGTPVISSPLSSITEVCKDSVLYANPYSVTELKIRMLQLFSEMDVSDEYSTVGKKRYAELLGEEEVMLSELVKVLLQ
jgi:glycosyltransferase involved in cell wall biosynthesis